MEIIIVCHTEFGMVKNRVVIAEKSAKDGVSKGVPNLIKLADKYRAKITFAVMPEVVKLFPKNVTHEIGLHVHPGWQEFEIENTSFIVGDSYLREHCYQSTDSTVLKDFDYNEQLEMIKTGRDLLNDYFETSINTFVSGRWSINNNTIKALNQAAITHDCSAPAHLKTPHFDWSRLPRICMPYHPDIKDYQMRGENAILIVPISQLFRMGNVNPEIEPIVGLGWLKACFLEYYNQGVPLFHICLHSPCMADLYYFQIMDNFLNFISKYDTNFSFARDVKEYPQKKFQTNIIPYWKGLNYRITRTIIRNLYLKASNYFS